VRAPGFSAQAIQGGSVPEPLRTRYEQAAGDRAVQPSELRGTPFVLYLWASRCAPCRANARLVEATWQRWAARGVLFLGLHVDESLSSAQAVLQQFDLTFPALLDRSGAIARRYGAAALPQALFVTADGNVVGEVVGSPSVRQLEVGTEAARSGHVFGSEQGTARLALD
jgi:hypothetical protein